MKLSITLGESPIFWLFFWFFSVGVIYGFDPIPTALQDNRWSVLPWFAAVVFFGLEFYSSVRTNALYRYADECLTLKRNEILARDIDKKEQKKHQEISEISRKLAQFFRARSITWSYCALSSFWSLLLAFIAFLLALVNIDYWRLFFLGSVAFLALCLSIHAFRIGFRQESRLMNILSVFPFLKVKFPDCEKIMDMLFSKEWI